MDDFLKAQLVTLGMHHFLKTAAAANPGLLNRAGKFLRSNAGLHKTELAGLGILAAPSVAHFAGADVSPNVQHGAEVAGLGVLAAPSVAHMLKGRRLR